MKGLEALVFKDKKFSNILEEIYDNQKKRDKQVSALISELRPLIQDTGDATVIVPLIKEYLEIGVKNDEQLVKLATIIQRMAQNVSEDGSLGISDEEKEMLMREINNLK